MAETTTINSSIETALHAVRVVGEDTSDVTALGSQMLLKQPEGFSLNNAWDASDELLFAFSSSEESSAFQERAMKKGWDANLELKSKENPFFQMHVSGSLEKNMNHREEEKREGKQRVAYIMKSLYIPKKSFQIPKHDMRLCNSALASVQEVKNPSDAFRFLDAYGSHVSQSLYHLGGLFFEGVTVSCAETSSFSDLLQEAARAMKGSATAKSSFVGSATVEGSSSSSDSQRTINNRASNFQQSAKRVRALGPTNVRDEEEFRSKLEEGPSSWSIINKRVDRVEDLVAVWNILLQERQYAETDHAKERLERAARLLYKAWLNKARSSCGRLPNQLIAALLECEERNYYRFQNQLQLCHVADEHEEEISPLAEALAWVSPAVELPQKLQTVLHDRSSNSDLSQKVSVFLRSCIAHLTSTPRGEEHLSRIVSVINRYGYDQYGNAEYAIRAEHLTSMIEDLNKLHRLEENSTEPHQHPADFNWENTSFSLITRDSLQTPAEYRYIGDVLVDKPLMEQKQIQSAHARQLALIDRLRHNLDPFPRPSLDQRKPRWNRNSSQANKLSAEAQQDSEGCVFEDLLQIMRGSDLPAQVGICRFLLQQRAATPLVAGMPGPPLASSTGRSELASNFIHWVQALSFVKVKLPEEKGCYIAEDLALPRVVFLSDLGVKNSRAATVASRILSCNFPSQHMNRQIRLKMASPVVAVGVGFLDRKPCLALHVEGPYPQLMDFVIAVADVIVLEQVKGSDLKSNFEGKRLVRWNIDVDDGYAEHSNEIWGTESYLVEEIGDCLRSELMDDELQNARRATLKELCIFHFHPHKLISFQYMRALLEECDLRKVRESLCLQDSFAREACSFFSLLKLKNNPGDRRLMEKECENEKKFRSQRSSSVVRNPLLQVFHMLLCQNNATERWAGLMWLQRYIFENTLGAKKDLGVVNLWRELCHIFVASPGSQRDLAKHAAQYLLDGFPLEILDGDASMFCELWVDTVLTELEILTRNALKRPARLFVFSAMGLQSSGKSTILNLMFGAQLMASAGRCTRGVFMQLVPSNRPEYDYVVILDTEGLRSPDFHNSEMGEVRDNRLAAFGLLPADASIFMISNEDDNGLKEVLPMVLLGFKGSLIAEENGGKIRAKMFFVYRSVDTNDKEKLNANKAKLRKHLAEASKEVASMGRRSSGAAEDEWLLQNMFQDLHVDEDEQRSDVRCMGNLKKGSKPPEDVPDWEYGQQVMELREHINRRVLEGNTWRSMGIREWRENLTRVWKCICEADFELSFKTAVECSSYAELQDALTSGPRRMVNIQFMEEFEKLEQKLKEFANTEDSEDRARKPTASELFTALQNGVRSVVITQTKFVKDEILEKRRWSKWKQEEENNWNMFCKQLEESYKSRIKDMCDGVLEYDAAARRYEMKMKKEIVATFQNNGLKDMLMSREGKKMARDACFNDVFQRILWEAEQSHPPLARDVSRKVAEAYERTRIAAEVDLRASHLNPLQTISNNVKSIFKSSVKPEELQKQLRGCIVVSLKDAKQYSEVVAESVISETNKMINDAGCSRDLREKLHTDVKRKLIAAFEKIQTGWDDEHNITAKLRGAEVRLRAFFENCADGIGASSMLISELEHLLQDALVERHHDVLVRSLSDSLSSNDLFRDWRKLRACLDLHLLTLIGNKSSSNTAQLLQYVAHGSQHYEAVTDVLIREQIEKHYNEQQERYLGIVLRSLEDAANSAMDARSTDPAHNTATVEFFLGSLRQTLAHSLMSYEKNSSCLPLGQYLFTRISRDAYEGGSSSLDSDFYKTGVKGLCQRLKSVQRGLVAAGWILQTLINGVRKRMETGNNDLGPRCTAQCPMCGILCIKAVGHTSKHDTVHQVSGLRGWHDDNTHELWKWSCYDDIVKGNRFRHQDTWYPAKDFEKVYPAWVNPCALLADASRSLQVREYIFYNYQDALSSYYNWKRCSDIPGSYNHDFQMLDTLVQNMLQGDYTELKEMFTQRLIHRP